MARRPIIWRLEGFGYFGHRRRRPLLPPPVHARAKPDPGSQLTVLVTGASGTLGRRVTAVLEDQKVAHQPAARDLQSLDLSGVSAVIVCATDASRPREVDLAQVDFFARTDLHVVYPSIVGCDVIQWSYYEAKTACEVRLAGSPHTIIRATQYHQLIWSWYTAPGRWPWLVVPAATRYQVLDPTVHAKALVDAALGQPKGRGPDVGGPIAYAASDLARSCQRATGSRRFVIPFNRPGLFGASLRAGANLTPNRDHSGETWNQFLSRQMQRLSTSP